MSDDDPQDLLCDQEEVPCRTPPGSPGPAGAETESDDMGDASSMGDDTNTGHAGQEQQQCVIHPNSMSNDTNHQGDSDKAVVATMDDFLLKTLDEMESRTEKLRETVKEAEVERQHLLRSLDTLMQSEALSRVGADERDELELYMDRLIQRLLTIDISVQIIRTPPQEQSLQIVRTLLEKLQSSIKDGDASCEMTIYRYLNSCMEEANGPVDDRFQGALLGCAAEDQKEIKKKLKGVWEAKEDSERLMSIFASMELK